MKVLHISNKPVYPSIDGGCMAMRGLLNCFDHLNYSVEHICVTTQKHPFVDGAYPKGLPVSSVEIDTSISPFSALKQLIKGQSYHLSRFQHEALYEVIRHSLEKSSFDLVVFDSLYSAVFINELRKHSSAKFFIRTHNVEYKIWRELAEQDANPFKKWYLNRLSLQLLKEEQKILNSADGILTITDEDAAEIKRIGITTAVRTIGIPLDTQQFKTDYTANTFYFVGSMNWGPNIEALQYLIHEIWPGIKSRIPDAELHLIGSFMDSQKIISGEGVQVHGFVNDLNDIYLKEGILLCPILSGSGVRIKVLEAMSKGAPILSTPKGAEGIQHDTNCLFIAESTADFIEKSIQLHATLSLRKELGENARTLIQNNYSLAAVSKQLDEFARKT